MKSVLREDGPGDCPQSQMPRAHDYLVKKSFEVAARSGLRLLSDSKLAVPGELMFPLGPKPASHGTLVSKMAGTGRNFP